MIMNTHDLRPTCTASYLHFTSLFHVARHNFMFPPYLSRQNTRMSPKYSFPYFPTLFRLRAVIKGIGLRTITLQVDTRARSLPLPSRQTASALCRDQTTRPFVFGMQRRVPRSSIPSRGSLTGSPLSPSLRTVGALCRDQTTRPFVFGMQRRVPRSSI